MSATLHLTQDAEDLGEVQRCAVCEHGLAQHDAISHRFCQATQAQALSRGCLCPKGS